MEDEEEHELMRATEESEAQSPKVEGGLSERRYDGDGKGSGGRDEDGRASREASGGPKSFQYETGDLSADHQVIVSTKRQSR